MRERVGYGLISAAVWVDRTLLIVAALLSLTAAVSAVVAVFDDVGWIPPFGRNATYAWQMAVIVVGLLILRRLLVWLMVRIALATLPSHLRGMPRPRRRRAAEPQVVATDPQSLALQVITLRETLDPRSARQTSHRGLLVFCLAMLVLVLATQGFSTHTIGATREPGSDSSRFAPLEGSRPLLTVDGLSLRSHQPPPGKRLNLSFDDGPDPVWTPKVMEVLRRHHVPATFFVVGSLVGRYPGIVRDLHDQGFELGNHTLTHADLATLPFWGASAQVALTESAIAGVTGVRPRLLRPPYSSEADAVTPEQARMLARLAGRGYVVALADIDPEDWSRPGVDHIVESAVPKGSTGGIVLLHDAGGDRSQTVAALDRLIPEARARGFKFVRIDELLGAPESAIEQPASTVTQLGGRLFVAALDIARWVTGVAGVLMLSVGLLVILRLLVVFLLARRHARHPLIAPDDLSFTPPVSIIVPAYNESVGIERGVRSLADSDYPDFEVIVVDDGSDDGTGDIVERMDLPNVRLIRQPNGGKPKALNNGVGAARHDFVVTVDGDTVFERGTLLRLVQPFRFDDVGAVSGNTKIGNRRSLLGRWQHIEYVMGFNLDRRMYEVLQCMPTVPGAIGAFRKDALVDVGRVSSATLAEDTDVTMAIGRAGWRVVYVQDAIAWTEAPSKLGQLWRQRYRWAYGTIQSIWRHRRAVLVRGDRIGRRAIPYLFLFQILMPLTAPLIDLFAIYGLIFLDPVPVAAAWVAFNLVQLALGYYAFRLDKEPATPLLYMPLQQFVYRQLMYLVVIESVINALAGSRLLWHAMERTGEMERGIEEEGIEAARA